MVDAPKWNIPTTAAAKAFVDQKLNSGRALLISPCSSHPARNWATQRYAAIADYAIEHHAMQVVLSGGRSSLEIETGNAIEAAMRHQALNLIGKDTLPQLVALLDRADLLISPDSGPAHLANALATPVIGLHASTWSRRSGPYHSLDLCVDKFADAAKRFRGKAPDQLRWGTRIENPGVMDLIQIEDVIERLDDAVESRLHAG